MSQSVVASNIIQAQIIDPQTGMLTREGLYWFQGVGKSINSGFDTQGNIVGPIGPAATLTVRGVPLVDILANIDNGGIVTQDGIDFSREYVNQNTNYIADGTGNPLAGGKAAYAALVGSAPSAGEFLEFNGTLWLPAELPVATDAAVGVVKPDGTSITVDPTGKISAAAGTGYLKGTVSVTTGATSGTFTGTGIVAGATTSMAAIASDSGSLIALCGSNQVSWVCDVTSANTVEVQVTLPNIGPTWGTITFSVVVFP